MEQQLSGISGKDDNIQIFGHFKFSDISYPEFKFASHFIFLPKYFLLELPEYYTQIKYSD